MFARKARFRFFISRRVPANLRKVLLRDDHLFDCCAEAVSERFESENVGSPLTDFLEWLLAHADEIIEFIRKIIQLFSAED